MCCIILALCQLYNHFKVLTSIVLKKLDLQLYLEGIIFDRELVIIMQGIHRAGQCQELLQIDNFPLSDHVKKTSFLFMHGFRSVQVIVVQTSASHA